MYFPLHLSLANFHMLKFAALENRVIHGTEFWTNTNIADGLTALATCIEVWCKISLLLWLSGLLNADDFLCGPDDVVLQLEGVSGATTRTPHKYLATTLGLD